MTITALEYEDTQRRWKLERTDLGPFHLLVGASGAGKTSAFNVLTGRLPLVAGTIRLHGSVRTPTWTRLAAEPRAGQTTLTLAQGASGWDVGLPEAWQIAFMIATLIVAALVTGAAFIAVLAIILGFPAGIGWAALAGGHVVHPRHLAHPPLRGAPRGARGHAHGPQGLRAGALRLRPSTSARRSTRRAGSGRCTSASA